MVDKIVRLVEEKSDLFACFENVYIFGSILNDNNVPNDLDILLIYDEDARRVLDQVSNIRMIFEEEIGLYVDLTVLSREEVVQTDFLNRIKYFIVK